MIVTAYVITHFHKEYSCIVHQIKAFTNSNLIYFLNSYQTTVKYSLTAQIIMNIILNRFISIMGVHFKV